jgi:hypothetical protein
MKLRTILLTTGLVLISLAAPGQPSERDIRERLEQQGYTQVRDINFGAEATTAKAVKDGKDWRLVVDSYGKVIQGEQLGGN